MGCYFVSWLYINRKVQKMKIVQVPFKDYYHEESPKSQIYLHHTAGTGIGDNVYKWWGSDKPRVATCVIIDRDGTIKQGFSSKYWAYHLGLSNAHFKNEGLSYRNLDKTSIGVELIGWGWVTKKNGKFMTYVNSEVDPEEVITLDKPFRGFKHWHKYTDAQIDSVVSLLKLWNDKYKIDISYNSRYLGCNHKKNGTFFIFSCFLFCEYKKKI
jgi:N-acetylmuramoyl-L-alanine amidase